FDESYPRGPESGDEPAGRRDKISPPSPSFIPRVAICRHSLILDYARVLLDFRPYGGGELRGIIMDGMVTDRIDALIHCRSPHSIAASHPRVATASDEIRKRSIVSLAPDREHVDRGARPQRFDGHVGHSPFAKRQAVHTTCMRPRIDDELGYRLHSYLGAGHPK